MNHLGSLVGLMLALNNPATSWVGYHLDTRRAQVPLMARPRMSESLSPGVSRLPREEKLPEGHIRIRDLLSTCVDACQKGMAQIRRVHASSGGDVAADYKITDDPRSALTAADLAAQTAIEEALMLAWPDLRIIGEEDVVFELALCDIDALSGVDTICDSDQAIPDGQSLWRSDNLLRQDSCSKLPDNSTELIAKLEDVTVFIDPLDGTREFVEGRIQNVQSLIGIAIGGYAVAGAIGLPFSFDSSPPVVYALIGAGIGVQGLRAEIPELFEASSKRPRIVSGDMNDPVLAAAYRAALADGGQNKLLGGTGQKILAVAEGRADVAIMNFKSNSWDTCALEAVIKASGGDLTDIFGERIVYRPEPPKPATYLNACGAIASAPSFIGAHHSICAALKGNSDAVQKLLMWGLEQNADGTFDADEVERVLKSRRDKLMHGI